MPPELTVYRVDKTPYIRPHNRPKLPQATRAKYYIKISADISLHKHKH